MPAWLASQVARLQTLAQLCTSEGRDLSSSGAMSRAQAAYQEAFTLMTDIVAVEGEWTVLPE